MDNSTEDKKEVFEIVQRLLSNFLDILRPSLDTHEFYILLYLLVIQRDGMLTEFKDTDLENEKICNTLERKIFSHYDKEFANISLDFFPLLKRLKNSLKHLLYLFNDLNLQILIKYFPEIFDDLLYKLVAYEGKRGIFFIQPLELTRFIITLASLPKRSKVYNPFAGAASFGVFLNDDIKYLGQEINRNSWLIGYLRILAYKRNFSLQLICSDSLQEWNPTQTNYIGWENFGKVRIEKEKFDLIVADPPFNARLQYPIPGKFGLIKTYEHFFIENGLEDLTVDGKLIAVIPNGFLSRGGSEYNLRKFLVQNDLLEMVISFPGGLFTVTGIPFCVLVINKNKKEKDVVQFISADNFIERKSPREKKINDKELFSFISKGKETDKFRIVSNNEIAHDQNDYDLSVRRYLVEEENSIIIDTVALEDIVKIRIKEESIELGTKGRFVKISDLKTDVHNSFLRVDELELINIPNTSIPIKNDSLLIALKFKKLNPTVLTFNQTKEAVFISSDILALKFENDSFDINYLIMELNSEFVQKQVDRYYSGTAIKSISKKDVLKLKIRKLSIDNQRKNVIEYLESLYHKKEEELTDFKRQHNLKGEALKEIASLKHSLGRPLLNIGSGIRSVEKILLKRIDIDVRADVEDIFKTLNKELLLVNNLLEVNENEFSPENYKLDELNCILFVEEYTKAQKNYSFELRLSLSSDIESVFSRIILITANNDLLSVLFNYILDNANRHAFKSQKKAGNIVEIAIQIDFAEKENTPSVLILIKNNGIPFPENFNKEKFIQKHSKAGDTGNTGIGGYDIYRIIEFMNGQFDLKINEDTNFPTCYEISFPIQNTRDMNDEDL